MAERSLGSDRPYLARVQPLPRRLADVTPEWLTGLLEPRYPGIVVNDFDEVELKSSHTTKLRVRLDLNDVGRAAGIPEHVCLKANWSGLRTGPICEREARCYHLISPLLSHRLDAPVPHAYFADRDDDGRGNGVVMMEDLGLSPGAFGASDDHLGIDAVAAGLETLALVHGAMWGDPRLESWGWLPPSMGTQNDSEQVIDYWNYIWFNLTDPEYEHAVPAWVYDSPEVLNHVLDELSAYEQSLPGPRCLVHGDAHQGNSFPRASGQRVWVDWQLVRKGTALRDVNYFVVGALTIFDPVLHTGVHGVLYTSRHAIPHMREAGGGAIINISAASSIRAIDGRPAYQASKGAINALTRQMAVDYGLDGIRSNAIIVGFTPTGGEIITKMVNNPVFIEAVKRAIPSPRLGSSRDIANGCVYLASDEAEYVNGVLLPIDGGLTCRLGIPDTSSLSAIGEG